MTVALRQIELASGSAADIGAVEDVMAAAFDVRFGEAWTRAQVIGILAMPGVWLTLAKSDGRTVGFTLSRAILDEAELLLLAVHPGVRRQGIGGALLRTMIAEARGRGVGTIHLEVRAGNGAVSLYAASGFAKAGERRGYYRGTDGRVHDAHSYRLVV